MVASLAGLRAAADPEAAPAGVGAGVANAVADIGQAQREGQASG